MGPPIEKDDLVETRKKLHRKRGVVKGVEFINDAKRLIVLWDGDTVATHGVVPGSICGLDSEGNRPLPKEKPNRETSAPSAPPKSLPSKVQVQSTFSDQPNNETVKAAVEDAETQRGYYNLVHALRLLHLDAEELDKIGGDEEVSSSSGGSVPPNPLSVPMEQEVMDQNGGGIDCGGVLWTEEGVARVTSLHTHPFEESLHIFWNAINVKENSDKSPFQYLSLFLPMDCLDSYCKLTSESIKQDQRCTAKHQSGAVEREEFLKFLGIHLLMARDPICEKTEDYWNVNDEELGLYMARQFGQRFGMVRERFRVIENNITFGEKDVSNEWWRISGLVDDFNARILRVFRPGQMLTVDESFSYWTGADVDHGIASGLPKKAFMKDKPKGCGILFRSLACGTTNIMLKLEIHEGKDKMELKEYQVRSKDKERNLNDPSYAARKERGEVYNYTGAVCLRLTKPYHHSNRVVVMDSFFGSVSTLRALYRFGLYGIGIVKRGHKFFPQKRLQDWYNELKASSANKMVPRGSCKFMFSRDAPPSTSSSSSSSSTSMPSDNKLMAVAWAIGDDVKCFVSSWGSTDLGNDFRKVYPKLIKCEGSTEVTTTHCEVRIPRPAVLESFYEAFPAVDENNKLRQGYLAIEERWRTHHWHMRAFATVLGVCVANAYFAYLYEYEKKESHMSSAMEFKTFVDHLIFRLIHGHELGSSVTEEKTSSSSSTRKRAPTKIDSSGDEVQKNFF